MPIPLRGSSLFTVPRAKPTHHPKRHLDRFSRFVWVPNAMLYDALPLGKKTPKIVPSPWDCVTMLEDRCTAIGNITKNLVDIKRVVLEIFWWRNRHRYTDVLITV